MIVKKKPKIDPKLIRIYEKFISAKDKTIPYHQKFLKSMNIIELDNFMDYISYKFKYDLKEYNKKKKQFKNNNRKLLDFITSEVIEIKDSETWKLDQNKLIRGVQLGAMYQMEYRAYQHDPFPLVIFLNDYDEQFNNFKAINLHYLTKPLRTFLVKEILKANKIRIDKKQHPILSYELIKKIMSVPSIIYRHYKVEHIRLIEYIPVSKWLKYLEIDQRQVLI